MQIHIVRLSHCVNTLNSNSMVPTIEILSCKHQRNKEHQSTTRPPADFWWNLSTFPCQFQRTTSRLLVHLVALVKQKSPLVVVHDKRAAASPAHHSTLLSICPCIQNLILSVYERPYLKISVSAAQILVPRSVLLNKQSEQEWRNSLMLIGFSLTRCQKVGGPRSEVRS